MGCGPWCLTRVSAAAGQQALLYQFAAAAFVLDCRISPVLSHCCIAQLRRLSSPLPRRARRGRPPRHPLLGRRQPEGGAAGAGVRPCCAGKLGSGEEGATGCHCGRLPPAVPLQGAEQAPNSPPCPALLCCFPCSSSPPATPHLQPWCSAGRPTAQWHAGTGRWAACRTALSHLTMGRSAGLHQAGCERWHSTWLARRGVAATWNVSSWGCCSGQLGWVPAAQQTCRCWSNAGP